MKNEDLKAKDITYIGIGVATMIVVGFVIYQLSAIFPMPGAKYVLMSPYLSMTIYILLLKIQSSFAILKIGCVFGFIMMIINIFMGVAILLTTVLTQLSIITVRSVENKAVLGAILFSGYTGFCALGISKYLIGGAFGEISNAWLVYTGVICLGFGGVGTLIASKLMKYMRKSLTK